MGLFLGLKWSSPCALLVIVVDFVAESSRIHDRLFLVVPYSLEGKHAILLSTPPDTQKSIE